MNTSGWITSEDGKRGEQLLQNDYFFFIEPNCYIYL